MELATRQLLRALRGSRSQVAFARRLGYRGNPIADWEAGRRTPTAEALLRVCARIGVDAPAALARFHP
ncbi:MAG: helix-turn-helix transcriptional regulator, partial [Myxococcales bacterium]|nr:helix-turn-helix transcriptional regulator [Myxococcales bacterium]